MADAMYSTPLGGTDRPAVGSATNFSLDANNDGLGFLFQAETADSITHVGFRYGARNGTPPTYIAALEGVDAGTGFPDGTALGGGTPWSATFTPPADATWDGTWQWIALDNATSHALGDLMALTIRYSSGTINGSNFSSFTRVLGSSSAVTSLPHHLTLTAGTWAKSSQPTFGYRTASGRYGIITTGAYSTTESTSGNRQAMRFSLPSGHGDTYTIAGLRGTFRVPTGATFKVGLWNAAGTALQERTIDADQMNPAGSPQPGRLWFTDSPLETLDFGTDYYIGFESISSSTIGISGIQLASADDRSAWPYGSLRGLATWNGSAWSEDNTVLPIIDIVLGDITEPSGGGGIFMPRAIQVGL